MPEVGQGQHLLLQTFGVANVHPLGQLVHVFEGKTQGLTHVANGALHLVGSDHAGKHRAVPSPLFVHPFDQFLPDVPGKVQIDVRHRPHLVVQETVKGEVELQGVDVGEAN